MTDRLEHSFSNFFLNQILSIFCFNDSNCYNKVRYEENINFLVNQNGESLEVFPIETCLYNK